MPNKVNFVYNELVCPFLLKSKHEALKRESPLNTFEDGALNSVDTRTKIGYLYFKQVLQLIKEHRAKLTFLAVYW